MNISEYERKVIKNIKTATLKAADKKLKCRNFVGFFFAFSNRHFVLGKLMLSLPSFPAVA